MALRELEDTRGSVAGRKGRYRRPGARRKEVTKRATIKRLYEPMSNVDSLASLRGACERVAPVHPAYANLPIEEGFGWEPLRGTDFGRLYLVVFRSLRREEADLDLRRERARQAHREAIGMGGLLRYFKGEANERRECLSFCLWERREQAERAAGGASHSGAASIAAQTYERYDLERYHLTKDGDAEGGIAFEGLAG
jgi:hypothetical protein